MNKNIQLLFVSLLITVFFIAGCSSLTKTGEKDGEGSSEAYADTSAPLPADSVDISDGIPDAVPDSLRRPQTRKPADTQIREQQTITPKSDVSTVEPQKAEKKTGLFAVQLGAFSSSENARKFALSAKKKLGRNVTVNFNSSAGLFLVQYGPFGLRTEAETAVKELIKKNFKDVFIVKTNE